MSFTANIDDIVAENHNRLLGVAPSWQRVRLKEVAKILNGYPFESARFRKDKGTPLLRIRDVTRGATETYYDGDFDPAFVVNRGELLIGMDGDFNCAPWRGEPALLNQRVCKITTDATRYSPKFLEHVLPGYLAAINAHTPSVTVKHLSSRTIADIPLPAPPLDEQERIVAEIEKQFTRLEAGVASLMRVQAALKRYRAGVLKAACEGCLVPTEAELARRESRSYETATTILARILADRREKWNGRGEYKEPMNASATGDSPDELPEGWTSATLDQLCPRFADSAHRTPKYGDSGVPALGPRDVVGGRLNLAKARLVNEAEFAIQTARHIPEAGDVIYSRELSLGWGAIVPDEQRLCMSQGMCLFRPHSEVSLRYFIAMLNGPVGRNHAEAAATGSAHPHINLGDIKGYVFPLPPFAEQHRIVAEVERRMSVIEEVESVVATNLQRATRLSRSVLQKAFSERSDR